MRPADFTLSAGPTTVSAEVMAAMGQPIIYHYDPSFLETFARTTQKAAKVFGTKEDVILMQGEAVALGRYGETRCRSTREAHEVAEPLVPPGPREPEGERVFVGLGGVHPRQRALPCAPGVLDSPRPPLDMGEVAPVVPEVVVPRVQGRAADSRVVGRLGAGQGGAPHLLRLAHDGRRPILQGARLDPRDNGRRAERPGGGSWRRGRSKRCHRRGGHGWGGDHASWRRQRRRQARAGAATGQQDGDAEAAQDPARASVPAYCPPPRDALAGRPRHEGGAVPVPLSATFAAGGAVHQSRMSRPPERPGRGVPSRSLILDRIGEPEPNQCAVVQSRRVRPEGGHSEREVGSDGRIRTYDQAISSRGQGVRILPDSNRFVLSWAGRRTVARG